MNKIGQMAPWIGKEERDAVLEYLDSGGWLTEFTRTRDFEQMIASYVGSKHACVVSNGTVSLAAAVMALGLERDDEIIVPDFTMIASANAVVLAGAKPVFADVNRSSLCLDSNLLEEAITDKTRAIMHVSLNGRCPDLENIVALARKRGLLLIEDAAQSLGSRYGGRHVGVFGDIGSFSLSPAKIITTGQGGALVTDNEELHNRLLMIKDYGRPQSGVDYHAAMGYNFKFTDLQAVIGIEQMKKLDWRVNRKKEIYQLYRDLLQGLSQITFVDTDLQDTAPWFIDVLVEAEREPLAEFLKAKGIGTRPFYPPIHTQPPYAHVKGNFKNAEYISQKGLWLPSSSFLTDADIERVCLGIKAYFTQ
ncbi:MAG: DegT/DnrJ/EryC1/StrS family aminotransferase [Candidatus Bathyarchaeota archaeon]|nr:DegT/DnrJ/EryC1/StrS family aminotransferase [Candidatus Bathyarchaeota archaeon]